MFLLSQSIPFMELSKRSKRSKRSKQAREVKNVAAIMQYFFGFFSFFTLFIFLVSLGLAASAWANLSVDSVLLRIQSEVNAHDKHTQPTSRELPAFNQQPVQINKAQQAHKAQTLIGQLAQSGYALMFFFDSSCSHCHHFAPTVKSISQTYGFQVFDFSFDGKGMSEFTTPAYVTQEIYHAYYGNARPFYPVLILQNVHTMEFYVVAEGDMPEAVLLQNLHQYAKELLYA